VEYILFQQTELEIINIDSRSKLGGIKPSFLMSWKKRIQWANSNPDPDFSPWINLFTLISLAITVFGLPLSQLPEIGNLIGLLFLLSLVTTPWLLFMTAASGSLSYGLPSKKKIIKKQDKEKN